MSHSAMFTFDWWRHNRSFVPSKLTMQRDSCDGNALTHWGRVTHICVGKVTNIGSDNGLSPERCQAFIWTSAGILLVGPLGTNFNEISIAVQTFSFKKMHLTMSSAKRCPLYLGHNVLKRYLIHQISISFTAIFTRKISCSGRLILRVNMLYLDCYDILKHAIHL